MKLSEIVNNSNKWIFCGLKVSRFLIFHPDPTIVKKKYPINFKLIKIIILSSIFINKIL